MTGILSTVSECFFFLFPTQVLIILQCTFNFPFLVTSSLICTISWKMFSYSLCFLGSQELDTWEHLKQKGIPALPDERFVLMAAILLCVIPVSTWRSASLCQNLPRLTHLLASPVLRCSEQSVLQALICLARHWLGTDSSSSRVMRQTFSIYSVDSSRWTTSKRMETGLSKPSSYIHVFF